MALGDPVPTGEQFNVVFGTGASPQLRGCSVFRITPRRDCARGGPEPVDNLARVRRYGKFATRSLQDGRLALFGGEEG